MWTDVTGYGIGGRAGPPRSFACKIERHLVITVTRHKDFPEDAWTLCCPQAGYGGGSSSNHRLSSPVLEKAQREALELVHRRISSWDHILETILGR